MQQEHSTKTIIFSNKKTDFMQFIDDLLSGNFEKLEAHVAAGFSINAHDELLKTALHIATEDMEHDAILWLLTHKACPNSQDSEGNTPLHYAALNEDIDNIQLLLTHNADPSIENTVQLLAEDYTCNDDIIALLKGGQPGLN